MKKYIKNPLAVLADVQNITSQVLSLADTCASVVEGSAILKGKDESAWMAEIVEYRDLINIAYSNAEKYLLEAAKSNGEEFDLKGYPIGMGDSYKSDIANMEAANATYVLRSVQQKIKAMLSKIESDMGNLSLDWSDDVSRNFAMAVEESAGMFASAAKGAVGGINNKTLDSSSEK